MEFEQQLDKYRSKQYRVSKVNVLGSAKSFIYSYMDNRFKKGNYALNAYLIRGKMSYNYKFEVGYNYNGYTLISDGLEFYLISDIVHNQSQAFYFYKKRKLKKLGYIDFSSFNNTYDMFYNYFKECSRLYHNQE